MLMLIASVVDRICGSDAPGRQLDRDLAAGCSDDILQTLSQYSRCQWLIACGQVHSASGRNPFDSSANAMSARA